MTPSTYPLEFGFNKAIYLNDVAGLEFKTN